MVKNTKDNANSNRNNPAKYIIENPGSLEAFKLQLLNQRINVSPQASIKKITIETEGHNPDAYTSPRNVATNSSFYNPPVYYTSPAQNLPSIYSSVNMFTSPIQNISSPAQAIQYRYIQQPTELIQPAIYQQVETVQPLQPVKRLEYIEVLQPMEDQFEAKEKSHPYYPENLKYSQKIPSYLDKSLLNSVYQQIPNTIEFDPISLRNNSTSESIKYSKKQHLVTDNF